MYLSRNLKTGSVYDVVGFAKNQYGWSDHSKTFTFFNKGVGKFQKKNSKFKFIYVRIAIWNVSLL